MRQNPSRLQRLLSCLFAKKGLSISLPLVISALLYGLFLLLGENPDKAQLARVAPFVMLITYGGIYLVYFIQIKNPMCSARFFYFGILFFLTGFSLSGVSLLVQFIADVRQGFTFSLPIAVNMWSVSALAYHQWLKRRTG